MRLIIKYLIVFIAAITIPTNIQANPTAEDFLVTAVYLNDVAAVKKHLSNPETVRKEIDPSCPRSTRCKPVTYAAENGSITIMTLLLEAGANIEGATGGTGDTPLILSLMGDHRDLVRFLVRRGANVNKQNNFGATPFWGVCAGGDLEFVRLFISKGAEFNFKGQFPDPLKQHQTIVTDITPLMISAIQGHLGVVNVLLKHGADVNAKDSLGRTAMEYAKAGDATNIIEIVRQLNIKQ